MSRATPRKGRHRNQPSGSGPRQIAASDYESDAVQYMENREITRDSLPKRDNDDINFSVLSRYLPGLRAILSKAAIATVYVFSEESQEWEKCGIEGTMWVCEQEPIVTASGQALPQLSVFVLNRRSLENLAMDLVRVSDCEMVEEILMFRMEEDDEAATDAAEAARTQRGESSEDAGSNKKKKVIGIWIHPDEAHTREVNTNIIRGAWQQSRLAMNSLVEAATAAAEQAQMDDDGATLGQAVQSEATREPQTEVPSRKGGSSFNPVMATNCPVDLFHDALEAQFKIISSFKRWLDRRLTTRPNHRNLLDQIRLRLARYGHWLTDVGSLRDNGDGTTSMFTQSWKLNARTETDDDGEGGKVKILVDAPLEDEQTKLFELDQYIGYMKKMFQGFAEAQGDIVELMEMSWVIKGERSELSQPPEVTIEAHKRLLKEYNDMKDIGQQIIGLVAENKGVSLGTMYNNGQYGVTAND
ncbi:hypothetical protein B0H66DRAFT_472345 [Apodospora peruviana]|uniref:Uncharacterized protein n=1 Tax=Apodospora peruviana TaxID=516989 RepID=A0AAE0MCM1_9PEZI|nr:hypothetical protein B0H66DRAFT_472345 [Apodospora peruviana]